jgi:hypothetical protein
MLGKDLKPGDILWGVAIKDPGGVEINCYYINSIGQYYANDQLVDINYTPIVDFEDLGLLLVPIYDDINNPFFIRYSPTCVWAYCSDGDKIVELYKECIENKLDGVSIECFDISIDDWGVFKIV